jgi:hypothetical protein
MLLQLQHADTNGRLTGVSAMSVLEKCRLGFAGMVHPDVRRVGPLPAGMPFHIMIA